MWKSPGEYAQQYRVSLQSLYPALRAGRVPGAKKVMGRAWRIWDNDSMPPTGIKENSAAEDSEED